MWINERFELVYIFNWNYICYVRVIVSQLR